MGRKRDSIVRNFFKFESEENVSKCQLCNRFFKGTYFKNLRRHLEECHSERVLLKNPIHLICARNHLTQLMRQILAMNTDKKNRATSEEPVSSQSSVALTVHDEYTSQSTCSLLNEYLNSIEVSSGNEESEDENDPDIKLAIGEINGYSPKPIGVNMDIMKYWEEKKFIYPRLY